MFLFLSLLCPFHSWWVMMSSSRTWWHPLYWNLRVPVEYLTFVCLGSSQTLYWATPPQRWWRNASLWGVKVGDQGVAWWAVCHRGRLSLWGGIAVGVWMIFGVGHDMCVFSGIGFWSSLYVFSLGGRLLNPTKPIMSMNRQNHKSPPCSTSNPTTQTNEINHEPSETNENDNQWPRFLIMEAADKNIPLNLNVFTLRKAVDGMANGRPKQCKPMKSGSIFIGVEKKHQSKNLLRTTMLMGSIPVKVTPHRTLNSRKFVIKCVELDNIDEEEIKNELEPQGIIAVKRISVHFSLYVMTIKGQDIPEKNQHWIHEKRNTTLYSQSPKMLPMPEIWTQKIRAKGKQFVLDVVRKDTMSMTVEMTQNV